ncbi:SprT-like domain-containing protein [Xylanibacter muris]|uniref:SprT domain-containing protein n=2 Tax=Xylanibacter muris TaxID=2736290 RepID=A0ABX2AM48_9BACT|nr:SprT-like domain-containing protein [Xylanibacter muris]NPD91845.1 sprT domain-containing protein [Xylanibacter muris]
MSFEITVGYMLQEFNRFNAMYFDGCLPVPVLKIGKARSALGTFSCRRKKTWLLGGTRLCDCVIRLSSAYRMTEKDYQNVLLHEMIHYYIAYKRIKDTSPHGEVFRKEMERINSFGWRITVRGKAGSLDLKNMGHNDKFLVLALKLKDGKCMITVVNPKYYKTIEMQIRRIGLPWHGWYVGYDAYFEGFSVVRTLRGRRVSGSLMCEKLSGLTEYEP